jgi:hypothetical protein
MDGVVLEITAAEVGGAVIGLWALSASEDKRRKV